MYKPVTTEPNDRYEEVDTQMNIFTRDGLHARVYFDRSADKAETIYANGKRAYGLATFVVFHYYETGFIPPIEEMRSPLRDLTLDR